MLNIAELNACILALPPAPPEHGRRQSNFAAAARVPQTGDATT